MGRLDFVTWLHCGSLERQFHQRGLRAAVTRGTQATTSFLSAERGDTRSTSPPLVREQMFIELMTPATLIAGMNWMIDLVECGNARPSSSLGYADEHWVWSL
jgi:hypothetical protein